MAIEPMQCSPDGRITVQFVNEDLEQYRVEFLDWPKDRVLFFYERDMIDIFNRIRIQGGFQGGGDYGSWKLTRTADGAFLWQSKNDTRQMKWTRAETEGVLDAYIRCRLWRRGEWPPYDWKQDDG